MNMITVTAKTLDEAITKALIELGTTSDNLEYTVIEKGSSGFLGLFGKNVVIRANKKKEDDDLEAFLATGRIDSSSLETVKEKKEEKKEIAKEPPRETKKENPKKNPQKNQKKNQQKEAKGQAPAESREETKAQKPTKTLKTPENPVEERKSGEPGMDGLAAEEQEERKPAKKVDVEACEKAAKEFLGQVFGAMGMEVTVTVSFEERDKELILDLAGPDMGILIGKRGQTLDSLQYLTSLVVNKECEGYVRVKLDTENYRERRKATLESLAKNIAYKVKRTRRSVSLEPMNPYERRIIHAALQNDRYVVTRSEGEDPFRHVVIFLKREGRERDRRDTRRGHGRGQSQEKEQVSE